MRKCLDKLAGYARASRRMRTSLPRRPHASRRIAARRSGRTVSTRARCDAPQHEGTCGFWADRKRQSKAPPSRRGFTLPSVHRRSMRHRSISTSTPGRDLLISTPGSRTRRRSSMVTSRSRTPLPTVMSRSRCTQFLLQSGPTQSSRQIRSALAGSENAADAAVASAMARI